MSYTPKNNFNLQLGRTGAGEKGFRKKLWKTIAGTCDALDYFFRWKPLYEGLGRNDFETIEVTGGIGDFNWSIIGAGFSLDNAVTVGRTNVVRTDGTVVTGGDAVVTVVDNCGSSVEGEIKSCYLVPYGDPDLPAYDVYGAGVDMNTGSLGINASENVWHPTFLSADTSFQFVEVFCGADLTIARDASGHLYATGNNAQGQYGNGTTINSKIFIKVSNEVWNKISTGNITVMGIKGDGTLWGTGSNSGGILGVGDCIERHSFTQEITSQVWEFISCQIIGHTLAIRSDGRLFGAGNEQYLSQRPWTPGYPSHLTEFTQIKYDDGGGSPYPIDESTWKWATCGSLAIKTDGTLWAGGLNAYGQLGFGDVTTRYFFEQVGAFLWETVSCNGSSTVAIKEDGTLWGWGKNDNGELGLGDTVQRTSPVQIGSDTWKKAYMCIGPRLFAIKDDDTLWGSGHNADYVLGLNHTNEVHVLTQEVNMSTWFSALSSGNHSMALLRSI